MNKYFVTTGCYLEKQYEVVETEDSFDQVEKEAYYQAMEMTQNWVGMYGFAEYEEELESGEMTQEEVEEAQEQDCENYAIYTVEDYVPEDHDPYLR